MKIGRILEEALIGEGQQPRWGVSKIGGIYLEEGVYYVIYGSRLKNSDSTSITGTSKTHIELIILVRFCRWTEEYFCRQNCWWLKKLVLGFLQLNHQHVL